VSLEICLYDFSPTSSRVATFSRVCTSIGLPRARCDSWCSRLVPLSAICYLLLLQRAVATVFAFRTSRSASTSPMWLRLRATPKDQSPVVTLVCDWFTVAHASSSKCRNVNK
jgi:hypothetical protein